MESLKDFDDSNPNLLGDQLTPRNDPPIDRMGDPTELHKERDYERNRLEPSDKQWIAQTQSIGVTQTIEELEWSESQASGDSQDPTKLGEAITRTTNDKISERIHSQTSRANRRTCDRSLAYSEFYPP
jgi:hypothetical protein